MRMTLEAALQATGGTLDGVSLTTSFNGVSIDSRAVRPGDAFIAIAGDRFDGHDYCQAAVDAGASLLVVAREVAHQRAPAVLRVDDTRAALGAIARAWREAVNPTVVAITGSMGKTTTKELTAGVCRELGSTHCTQGNFNNEIGLPLTLLAMPEQTRVLVTEMGMNAPGEIARLAAIARPDIGLVTNVAPVHLEALGSLEAIARAKGELLEALDPDHDRHWAVLPSDEPHLEPHAAHLPAGRRLRFGEAEGDDIRILSVVPRGERLELELRVAGTDQQVQLPLVGRYNARNAAAAAAVGHCLGLSPGAIAGALAEPLSARLGHRSALRRVAGWTVLDDCYNANPRANRAALDTIVELAAGQRAVAVLGEMLELGPEAPRYHREVGAHAAGLPLAALVTVGAGATPIAAGARAAGMTGARVFEVNDTAEAVEAVLASGPRDEPGWLLIKGSRGARLEALLELLDEKGTRSG